MQRKKSSESETPLLPPPTDLAQMRRGVQDLAGLIGGDDVQIRQTKTNSVQSHRTPTSAVQRAPLQNKTSSTPKHVQPSVPSLQHAQGGGQALGQVPPLSPAQYNRLPLPLEQSSPRAQQQSKTKSVQTRQAQGGGQSNQHGKETNQKISHQKTVPPSLPRAQSVHARQAQGGGYHALQQPLRLRSGPADPDPDRGFFGKYIRVYLTRFDPCSLSPLPRGWKTFKEPTNKQIDQKSYIRAVVDRNLSTLLTSEDKENLVRYLSQHYEEHKKMTMSHNFFERIDRHIRQFQPQQLPVGSPYLDQRMRGILERSNIRHDQRFNINQYKTMVRYRGFPYSEEESMLQLIESLLDLNLDDAQENRYRTVVIETILSRLIRPRFRPQRIVHYEAYDSRGLPGIQKKPASFTTYSVRHVNVDDFHTAFNREFNTRPTRVIVAPPSREDQIETALVSALSVNERVWVAQQITEARNGARNPLMNVVKSGTFTPPEDHAIIRYGYIRAAIEANLTNKKFTEDVKETFYRKLLYQILAKRLEELGLSKDQIKKAISKKYFQFTRVPLAPWPPRSQSSRGQVAYALVQPSAPPLLQQWQGGGAKQQKNP